MLSSHAKQTLGTTYSLIGNIQVHIIHATITDQARGITILAVRLDGICVYQLSPSEKQHLVKLIAGKPTSTAIHTLVSLPGVLAASITSTTATQPNDPGRIRMIVVYRGA